MYNARFWNMGGSFYWDRGGLAKPAILRSATAAAEREGAIVIRLDAEAYPGVDGLVRATVTASAQKLKSDVAKTGEKILRFFSRLRPSISYDSGDNSWSGSLDAVKTR